MYCRSYKISLADADNQRIVQVRGYENKGQITNKYEIVRAGVVQTLLSAHPSPEVELLQAAAREVVAQVEAPVEQPAHE